MASFSSQLFLDLTANGAISSAFKLAEHQYETDLAVFDFTTSQMPALVVVPGEETTEPTDYDSAVVRKVTKHVYCLIVARHEDLDSFKQLIRTVAIGWQNDPKDDLLEFEGGAPIRQAGPFIYWLETYTARSLVRQT